MPVINHGTGGYPEPNRKVKFKLMRYAGIFFSALLSEEGSWRHGRTRTMDIYSDDGYSYRYNDYVYSWEYVDEPKQSER